MLTHVHVLRDAVTELLASPAPFAAALAALDAFTVPAEQPPERRLSAAQAAGGVGPARCCLTRRPMHCQPSLIELHGLL